MTETADFNDIQLHMLGVIRMIMDSYNIPVESVAWYFDFIKNMNSENVFTDYNEFQEAQSKYMEDKSNSGDEQVVDEQVDDKKSESNEKSESDEKLKDEPIYVTTRREFCSVMNKGIKICPRYSNCDDRSCKNFHIESKYICQHVTRGSYCDQSDCELIVIRPCRKGKRCNDPECSFRH